MWGILAAAGNPNAYDVTTWDPNVDQVTFASEAFYNTPAVKEMLHAPMNITWHGCQGFGRRRLGEQELGSNGQLKRQQDHHEQRRKLYMNNDRPISVVPYVAELLDADIPVLVYNGDRDMTTNMVGSELLLNDMEWKFQSKWLDAPRGLWMLPEEMRKPHEQKQAGWAKEYGALSFVVVYNSGHMVPYNQPAPAHDLLERFLKGESFVDEVAPTIRVNSVARQHKKQMREEDIDTTSIMPPITLGNVLPTSTTRLDSAGMDMPELNNSVHHHALTSVISMFIGAVLAIMWMKRSDNRRQYERVQEASL
jgi:hypothetical protein